MKLTSIDTTLYRIPLPVPIQAASTSIMNLDYSSAAKNKDCKHLYITDII
ncbi:MAG: hypothetical protein QF416_10255 [Candidatus Marinimicrobia bacterium]|nr:hypothetical protein [Candidatus Neomarinimicrobiota bacterium]